MGDLSALICEIRTYKDQHVWNGDNIRLVSYRHAPLKVVASVLLVGHCVVGMESDVLFLDALSDKETYLDTQYM